jgi:hypothetical protein
MAHKLNSFEQLIEELSMIKYENVKKFDPVRVEFGVIDKTRCQLRTVKDSKPFSKLKKAYEDKRDVRVADFYGSEIRIGVSFADGMREYSLGGVAYLAAEGPRYLKLSIPSVIFT